MTPCPVEDDDGEHGGDGAGDRAGRGAPAVQRRGVGSALMAAATSLAVARAVPALVLLGHPSYYPRFGFEPARGVGLEPPAAAWPDAAWMARLLPGLDRRRCAGPSATTRRSSRSPEAAERVDAPCASRPANSRRGR